MIESIYNTIPIGGVANNYPLYWLSEVFTSSNSTNAEKSLQCDMDGYLYLFSLISQDTEILFLNESTAVRMRPQ